MFGYAAMTIKFILIKFIEMTIKTVIVLCFLFSLLVWAAFFILLAVYHFDINFLIMNNCIDMGVGWDMEHKGCRWL
jgi:hypothetical protein